MLCFAATKHRNAIRIPAKHLQLASRSPNHHKDVLDDV
jgi:hypothetical protein